MSTNTEIAANIFGYAGVIANLTWPLMKIRSRLLTGQVIACGLMLSHFLLLGANTGAAIMGVAGLQAALAVPLGLKSNFKYIYIASFTITPVVCYVTWQGTQSIFSSLALAIVCVANYQLNQIHQRFILITAIFAWFIHNLIVGSSPGIVSNILALIVSVHMLFITIKSVNTMQVERAKC